MAEYLSVEEARARGGLRLVLTAGVPGPWGESAKGVFAAKKIPYLPVLQQGGMENAALLEWTGRDNAPQAVHEDEPARTGWLEILWLAERLAPDPPLVPDDPNERVRMLGLAAELCGEGGFGWQRRLMLLDPMLGADAPLPGPIGEIAGRLGRKYGYSREAAARAPVRVAQTLDLFSETLRAQQQRGSRFLVGERLSAVDIYWAAFAAMVEPLPHAQCPMAEPMRAGYTIGDAELRAHCDPVLLAHRDAIYRDVMGLPIDL